MADKPKKASESPFVKGLRGLFGMGLEGQTRAMERSGNVFERMSKKIAKDTETLKRKKKR